MEVSPIVLSTAANIPRFGVCSGCRKKFQLAGSLQVGGYRIPAHHSPDLNGNCSGSDKPPSEVIPYKE